MNKIDLIREEFPKQFTRKWEELTGSEEGRVEHPKYGGRATSCRSTMYTLVKILKSTTVWEIGSWGFASSNIMALAMDELGIDGRIDSFDIAKGGYNFDWKPPTSPKVRPNYWYPHHTTYDKFKYSSPIMYPEFRNMTNEEIFQKNLDIMKSVAPPEGYSLIFIDGDHSHEGVSFDWKYAMEFSNKDTVIVIDDLCDIRHAAVKRFFDELDVTKYDFQDWNEDPKKPLLSTGVALVV